MSQGQLIGGRQLQTCKNREVVGLGRVNYFVRLGMALRFKSRALAKRMGLKLLAFSRHTPRDIFWDDNGILKWESHNSGEEWFISNCLPVLLSGIENPGILDVGANVGNYSKSLAASLPQSSCYALEPNPEAFLLLLQNVGQVKNIVPLNLGASNQKSEIILYVYANQAHTDHASIYKNVIKELHGDSSPKEISCQLERIDDLIENHILPNAIHFIKVDTEGHELQALQGAQRTIRQNEVRVVQFEFNEMNVISRVFLKDFYEFFGGDWQFYRLNTHSLIPLGPYDSVNEIFKFHNIIAINTRRCSAHALRLMAEKSHQ